MNKHWLERIREDFWVIVMDIIAVNAAYMLTFFLRYYVHSKFVPAAIHFVSDYLRFAPVYTVLCLVIFALFGLYGGMWRYANVNSMNRIIAANGAATILLLIGTSIFTERLPVNIYAIGASLQFLFTVIIRYAYRIVDMERRRFGSRESKRNVLVIGTGVNAANMIRYLSGDSLYNPVVVVGSGNETYVRGLPVTQNMEMAVQQYNVHCIIVADPVLSDRKREALRRVCEHNEIELHDYSGFLNNQSGELTLTRLTRVIPDGAKVRLGEKVYDSVEQAMEQLSGQYNVVGIIGRDLTIEIKENTNATTNRPQSNGDAANKDASVGKSPHGVRNGSI